MPSLRIPMLAPSLLTRSILKDAPIGSLFIAGTGETFLRGVTVDPFGTLTADAAMKVDDLTVNILRDYDLIAEDDGIFIENLQFRVDPCSATQLGHGPRAVGEFISDGTHRAIVGRGQNSAAFTLVLEQPLPNDRKLISRYTRWEAGLLRHDGFHRAYAKEKLRDWLNHLAACVGFYDDGGHSFGTHWSWASGAVDSFRTTVLTPQF